MKQTNLSITKRFLKIASAAGLAGALLTGCGGRVPLSEGASNQSIPPDHVPVGTHFTNAGTCSLPVMGIYTDQMTGDRVKRIIGGTNVACGGWEPKITETGFCFDTNVPRPSSRGFTYDRNGNISGQRQEYERPQPGYCPTGEFYQYVIR